MRFRLFSGSPLAASSPAGQLAPRWVCAALLVLTATSGCAGPKAEEKDGKSKSPDESAEDSQLGKAAPNPNLRSLSVDSTRCPTEGSRTDQKDLNNDGRADLVSIYLPDGTQLSCRQADFNFDGRLDAYFHYDKGALAREQFDLDYDGRIDIGRTFKDGKLILDEQDTNRDGFVDAWRRYDKGRLLRIETDRDGDGRADMFAYYVAGRVDRIGYDVNGDGRVDQWDHDAARRAREAEAVRKENEQDAAAIAGGTTDDYVDESPEDGEDAEAAPEAKAAPKPATAAPERTGGGSLKPKAGAGDDPKVEAGEAKSIPDSKKKDGGDSKDAAAKPATPAKPVSPAKPSKPKAQSPQKPK